jgi:hypothetical protein
MNVSLGIALCDLDVQCCLSPCGLRRSHRPSPHGEDRMKLNREYANQSGDVSPNRRKFRRPPTFQISIVGTGCEVGLEAASDLDRGSPTFRISTEVRKVQGIATQFLWQRDDHPCLLTPAGILGGLGLHPPIRRQRLQIQRSGGLRTNLTARRNPQPVVRRLGEIWKSDGKREDRRFDIIQRR